MGVEQTVEFPADDAPSWDQVRAFLGERGVPVQMRMIDGQLAFPDESPAGPWTELRVAAPGGMATIRRRGGSLAFVVFGGADEAMLQSWNALAWAFAHLGQGTIQSPSGPLSADEFRAAASFPAGLRD